MKPSQRKYQIVIVITLGVYLYYLVYRFRYTINPDSFVLSIGFFYAEVHGFIALFFYFFQIWKITERKASLPTSGLTVDVYIPTYNEDIFVLKKTALGCINIKYPHKTYILDDGNRPELAKRAAEWGCGYIARKERMHAKAGNLNNALQLTQGEFVAIFDADFVPQTDFLDKTLGYFRDQKVAFVQTPHNYYNIDSFQFRINKKKEKSWNEQDIFYRLMMPGRDYWNSTFFAGTAAVLRKKALEDIGGFATGTITEDLQTSILLYAHGWKGVYHNEVLSNGLAAKDFKNYHIQLLRWAEGNIGLFFRNNPFVVRGLTIPQKICFFAVIFGWLIGFPKLIYFVMPSVMILTGGYPIGSFDFPFIWRYVMFLAVIIGGFKFASRGYGKIRYAESYVMMNFFILIKAAFKNIFRMKSIFKVTGKSGRESIGVLNVVPQLLMCFLCLAGITWGGLKWYYGISSDFIGIGVAIFWSIVNGFLALSTIELVTRPYQKRRDFRFLGAVPVQYSIDEDLGTIHGVGVTKDINEYGIALVAFSPLPVDKKITLSLHLNQRILHCKADVLYVTPANGIRDTTFVYGIKFDGLSEEEKSIIIQYCFTTTLPRFLHKFSKRPSFVSKMFFKYYNQERFRKHVRRRVDLPLIVRNNGNPSFIAVTNDISMSGLSFISHVPFELGEILKIEVFTPFGTLVADGEIRRTKDIASGQSYFIGVKFTQFYENLKSDFTNQHGTSRRMAKEIISAYEDLTG